MQIDMHFHATHAVALLAGLSEEDALIVATAAEFVDDADYKNSGKNKNREMLFAICAGHHPAGAATVSLFHPEGHRLVWVPFHFLPGGEGNTLEEKLLCVKNSKIANQMFEHHTEQTSKNFYWHLVGIASHVYLDTFSHYGFNGIVSELNRVVQKSIDLKVHDTKMREYILKKAKEFSRKYGAEISNNKLGSGFCAKCLKVLVYPITINLWNRYVLPIVGETGSNGLGHGAVATFPDRPYLVWSFRYEQPRGKNNSAESGERNNPKTFLEGLENLHGHLAKAANRKYPETAKPRDFFQVKEEMANIISREATGEDRCNLWKEFIRKHFGIESEYRGDDWNKEKDEFENKHPSEDVGHCYKFHQAAAIHRWYVMKDLLPEHGIYCL